MTYPVPRVLLAEDLRFVWEAVHDRYCRQAVARPIARVTFTDLDNEQQRALAGLLGSRRLPGMRTSISIDRLDARLLASDAALTARQVAEAICGPVINRPEASRAEREAVGQRWARLTEAAGPRLEGWIEHLRRSGMATRAAGAAGTDLELLMEQALEVVSRLPADGMPLAKLAGDSTGDTHALDRDRPLRSLVLSAVLHFQERADEAVPAGAAAQRALLDRAGVVCDSVSSSALVLNLPAVGSGYLDRLLVAGLGVGEPVRVTLRSLLLHGVAFNREARQVFICENPSVLQAAADHFGARAAPVVCTEGWPMVAALRMLEQIRSSGLNVMFSADFDRAGLQIGNLLTELLGALPWRMSAGDYKRAVARSPAGVPLGRKLTNAAWDARLTPTMRERGTVVFEEHRLEELLGDLLKY